MKERVSILMVDHRDSFVHTLSSYFQQCGADVVTVRHTGVAAMLEQLRPQLVVLSPGPGRPEDFGLAQTLDQCLARRIPVFGVCLGLQGIVEYFGGGLGVLGYPIHGKKSPIGKMNGFLFDGIGERIQVGRYHSLVAEVVPECLSVTASTEDGVVMAVEHKELPIAAVQFHPESILTLETDAGFRLIRNVMNQLCRSREPDTKVCMPSAGRCPA